MEILRRFRLALAATVFALFALPFAASALVSYPAGSMLQPGDVSTTTLRDFSVSPSKLATNSNFTMQGLSTTNSTSTNATTTTLAVTGSTLALNGVVYTTPNADGTAGQFLSTNGAKVLSFVSPANTNYGTGSDGALNVTTGTTTLTSDKSYSNVTVSAGAAIETNGYVMYVSGTLTNNGIIENNGSAGNAGQGGGSQGNSSGGTGGLGGAGGSLAAGITGANGGAGGTGTGGSSAGTAGTSKNPSLGVNGAAGGAGGSGVLSGSGGGAGGTATIETLKFTTSSTILPATITVNTTTAISNRYTLSGNTSLASTSPSAGSGGGGGGGSPNCSGGGGGGGGGGGSGGNIAIYASSITNSATGIIQANGGPGGTGAYPGSGGQCNYAGGGGGGGGGSGGVIMLTYTNLTNSGTIQALGGTAGIFSGNYSSTGGGPGAVGNAGNIYKVNI